MKAIILAGGRGTRLMPLTKHIPKPLVPIVDKPVMWYIIRLLREAGIRQIGVTLGYLGEQIESRFGDGKQLGVELHYFYEKTPLGTAGCVQNAKDFLDEDFVVVSGDAYTDLDIGELVAFHYATGGLVTIASHFEQEAGRFGVINADNVGLITRFEEKPLHPTSHLVNMGIYVCDKRLLHFLPQGNADFAKDIFPHLLGNIYTMQCDCYWSDIGTLPSYYMTNYMVVSTDNRDKVAATI